MRRLVPLVPNSHSHIRILIAQRVRSSDLHQENLVMNKMIRNNSQINTHGPITVVVCCVQALRTMFVGFCTTLLQTFAEEISGSVWLDRPAH